MHDRLIALQAQLAVLEQQATSPEIKEQIVALQALCTNLTANGTELKGIEDISVNSDSGTAAVVKATAIEISDDFFAHLTATTTTTFVFDKALPEGTHAFIAKSGVGPIYCELGKSSCVYIADVRKQNLISDELRHALWPRKHRLYCAPIGSRTALLTAGKSTEGLTATSTEAIAPTHNSAIKLDPRWSFDAFEFLITLQKALNTFASQFEIFRKRTTQLQTLTSGEQRILENLSEAIQFLLDPLATGNQKVEVEKALNSNVFEAFEPIAQLLQKHEFLTICQSSNKLENAAVNLSKAAVAFNELYELSNEAFIAAFTANLTGESIPAELVKAEKPEGALPVLKLPNPKFNINRLKAKAPTGLLSRLPRLPRINKPHFLLNEIAGEPYDKPLIWGAVALGSSTQYKSMADIPEAVLDGLDSVTKEEFSTEQDIYYFPLTLIAEYKPPIELARPVISRRFGPIISIPQSIKKSADDACSTALDFLYIEKDSDWHILNVQKAGPSDRYAPILPGRGPDLPPLVLHEVLNEFHKEFVLRAPFIHLVGSTVNNGRTLHDIDLMIKGPLDPETEHAVKFRLGRMLPSYMSERVQFLSGEKAIGPYGAHTALYDLIVRRRDDYAEIVEMAVRTNIAKQDNLLTLPEKGDGPYPAVLQAHFRGNTVHGDLRIKTNGQLIGFTLSMQKLGKIKNVETLAQAKNIAHAFDARGSWWNKAFTAPSRVFATPKQSHPSDWLDIEEEGFEPGTIGGTRFKPGFMVAIARPKITFGTQTPYFHEYFLEDDSKLQGILTFRLIAQPSENADQSALSGAYWTAMFTKSALPSVLKRRAVETGRIPPKGYSALPSAIKEAIPKRFQYWLAEDEKERIAIRDALVEERLFTERNIRLLGGKIKPVLVKYFTYDSKEIEEEHKAPQHASHAQLFPTAAWLNKAVPSILSNMPRHENYLDLFFDFNGGLLTLQKALAPHTVAHVDEPVLATDMQSLMQANTDAKKLLEPFEIICSRKQFTNAQQTPLVTGAALFCAMTAEQRTGDFFNWVFASELAGTPSNIKRRWLVAQKALQQMEVFANQTAQDTLQEFLAKHDQAQSFIFITPPSLNALTPLIPILAKVRAAKFLIVSNEAPALLLQAAPWLDHSTDSTPLKDAFYTANFTLDKKAPKISSTQTRTELQKTDTLPFTLAYQWWRGPVVVRHGPSHAVFHLFLQRGDSVEDFQLQQDPLSTEIAAAIRRELKEPEVMSLTGQLPPGSLLNPSKDTPSFIRIMAQGQAQITEDGPLFKKISFAGKDLPPGLKGEFILYAEPGSTEMWLLERTEAKPGTPIEKKTPSPPPLQISTDTSTVQVQKQVEYKTIEFKDGSKLEHVQVWDPKNMADSDDKTHAREQLAPPAIFRPMKPAARTSTSFRTNEMNRLYTDFATDEILKTGLIVEPKYNGWRTVLQKTGSGELLIIAEDLFDLKQAPVNYAHLWPSVAQELEKIPGPFIIDGEFTALNEAGGNIPRRELAAYRSSTVIGDTGIRIQAFDMLYGPTGNIMTDPYIKRRQVLAQTIEAAGSLRHLNIAPFRVVHNRKELQAAIRWARSITNSEGAMLKSVQHTATLNENDLIAKIKAVREIHGIVYDRAPVKGSDGVYNFFYAIGPIDTEIAEGWKDVVEVAGDLYIPMGKTFNVKLNANIGDVLRIEVTEILYDKAVPGEHQIRGFTPTVIDVSNMKPSSLDDILHVLEPGEVKKSSISVRDSIAKSLASSNLELIVLKKRQEERYIKGVVLIPDEFDAHGDIYDEATVRDACHHFMEYSEALGKQHAMALSKAKIRILECYLADTDCLIEGHAIKRGTWLLAARVLDDLLWEDIKAGRCTGWSIEGSALAELLI